MKIWVGFKGILLDIRTWFGLMYNCMTGHTGANPFISKNNFWDYWLLYNPSNREVHFQLIFKELESIKLKIVMPKNVRISLNRQKKSTVYHKTTIYGVHSEYIIKKIKIWYPDFFPDFPDPVFSRKKKLLRLAHGQTLRHFVVNKSLFHILLSLATWQKLADMKNAKNILFWGKEPLF